MDELPNQARELLRLASDMHDPPHEARARVRRGVAVAMATGVAATIASQAVAQGTVKAGLFSGMAAKLAGAGVAVAVVSALAVTAPQLAARKMPTTQQAPSHQGRPNAQPIAVAPIDGANGDARALILAESARAAQQPATLEAQADTSAHVPKTSRTRAQRTAPASGSSLPAGVDGLGRETILLKRASQAIAQGDPASAQRLLAQHASQFRDSVLREERDGLRAIVRCMQNPARAKREGAHFVAQSPESVLAQRVLRVCQLEGKP